MQQKSKESIEQVEYMGRWVPKKHFRVFVYSENDKKLANSYEEYQELLSTGLWYGTKSLENSQKVQQIVKKPQKKEVKVTSINEFNSSRPSRRLT